MGPPGIEEGGEQPMAPCWCFCLDTFCCVPGGVRGEGGRGSVQERSAWLLSEATTGTKGFLVGRRGWGGREAQAASLGGTGGAWTRMRWGGGIGMELAAFWNPSQQAPLMDWRRGKREKEGKRVGPPACFQVVGPSAHLDGWRVRGRASPSSWATLGAG